MSLIVDVSFYRCSAGHYCNAHSAVLCLFSAKQTCKYILFFHPNSSIERLSDVVILNDTKSGKNRLGYFFQDKPRRITSSNEMSNRRHSGVHCCSRATKLFGDCHANRHKSGFLVTEIAPSLLRSCV